MFGGTDSCSPGPECSITGDFTLAAPLPGDDTVWYPSILSPSSYFFTDGDNTWTNLNSTVNQFSVKTNAGGIIDEWDIGMSNNTTSAALYTASVPLAFTLN